MKKTNIVHFLTFLILLQSATSISAYNVEWLMAQKDRARVGMTDAFNYCAGKTKIFLPKVSRWIYKHKVPLTMAACSAAFIIWACWPKKVLHIVCDDQRIPLPEGLDFYLYSSDLSVECAVDNNTIAVSYIDPFAGKKMLFFAEYNPNLPSANSNDRPGFTIKKQKDDSMEFVVRAEHNGALFNFLNGKVNASGAAASSS